MKTLDFSVKIHSCFLKADDFPVTNLVVGERYISIPPPGKSKEELDTEEKLKVKRKQEPWFRRIPKRCKCRRYVTFYQANEICDRGEALWVQKLKRHQVVIDDKQIWMPIEKEKVPRVDMITAPDIVRAYCDGNDVYIKYIEEVHKMTMEFRSELIVPFRPDPFEGRLLFPFSKDQRTVGGYEKPVDNTDKD